jgi:hypothetical protein
MRYITVPAKVTDEPDQYKISIKPLGVEATGLGQLDTFNKIISQLASSLKHNFPKDSLRLEQEDGKWHLWSSEWKVLYDRVLELEPLPKESVREKRRRVRSDHLNVC